MSTNRVTKLNFLNFRLCPILLFICMITINAQAKDKPYPGKLVDIGTHRLHINCVGEGSPSVIIDSGIGGFSLEWFKIQNQLSNDVRVCSYDRAGYGWSELGPRPRTTARITRELRSLLTEANIPGPYLLVGHSFGGYNIRYFTSEYPELVAGLVFIDASHPQQFNTKEFKRTKSKQQDKKYKRSIQIRLIHPIIADNYPEEKKRIAYRLMSSLKSKSTLLNESDFMEISANQVAARNEQPYKFPVVIITRGKRVWPDNEMGNRREQQWSNLQNDLENIGIQSEHFLAYKSGHIIHLDQPNLVIENILFAVNKARHQVIENELMKKFDIRHKSHLTFPANETTDTAVAGEIINSDKYSILDAPMHLAMFDQKLFFMRNRKSLP